MKGIHSIVRWWRIVGVGLAALAVYATLYICRFVEINSLHECRFMPGRELNHIRWLYSDAEWQMMNDPHFGYVWVYFYDLDDDVVDEALANAGVLNSGWPNEWTYVFRKGDDGKYQRIGAFGGDDQLFVPPWYIYGMPSVWCSFGGRDEWVPWRDGRYEGSKGKDKY